MQPTAKHLRIQELKPLAEADAIIREIPLSPTAARTVTETRNTIRAMLNGADDRLLVVIGPCSIHDPVAAIDYAERLARVRETFAGELEVVMRVYFEKPRTTIGWKGLINDPHLDGSFDINAGLRISRQLLAQINEAGVPAACEYLDPVLPLYMGDMVSWAAIGARTTESQPHRELASASDCPIGFKNGTSGDFGIAIDAMQAAAHPHHFMAVMSDGRAAIAVSEGNPDCHLILRGGIEPNYDAASVDAACAAAERAGQRALVLIDTSHANSRKIPENQPLVAQDVARQIEAGEHRTIGLMVESNLVPGRQNLGANPLTYGQSITDGCIGWDDSVEMLTMLANAVATRRSAYRLAS
jgi:3-deoxy-7-phosphoheptulonate synthase